MGSDGHGGEWVDCGDFLGLFVGIWFCLAGISGISGICNLGLGLIVLLVGGQDGRMGGVGGFVWVR